MLSYLPCVSLCLAPLKPVPLFCFLVSVHGSSTRNKETNRRGQVNCILNPGQMVSWKKMEPNFEMKVLETESKSQSQTTDEKQLPLALSKAACYVTDWNTSGMYTPLWQEQIYWDFWPVTVWLNVILGECRNLQELNVSECYNITVSIWTLNLLLTSLKIQTVIPGSLPFYLPFLQDMMIQKITEGCPCLLYLNLSCTYITNKALRELSRCTFTIVCVSYSHDQKFPFY